MAPMYHAESTRPTGHPQVNWLRAARAAALLAATWLAGCASSPTLPPVQSLWRDAAYPAPAQPLPTAEALFALSEPMERFVQSHLVALPSGRDPRRALVEALYKPSDAGGRGLRLSYDTSLTRNAAQAFETRTGNCLSLVMMTAAFARRLGLGVAFQSVHTDAYYTRNGTLTVASGHVNLLLDWRPTTLPPGRPEPERLVVDFLRPIDLQKQRTEPLSEATIVAMYFNNRAAELLAANDKAGAYWHAREALRHDPRFLEAVNTLGVVHQRAGQAAAAEQAFRRVLAADARSTAALSNLLSLLQRQGRDAEATPVAERLAALQPVPPLHWLRLGSEALAAGDAQQAVMLLKRELRRQPEQDEVHLALAEAYLRLGDRSRSSHHLAQAVANSPRRDDQLRYAAKLARLRAQAATEELH